MGYIYQLNFSEGNAYIGQTVNLRNRLYSHRYTKGSGSPLLKIAFDTLEYLGHDILLECDTAQLDTEEIRLISERKPTLNTLPGGRCLRGLNHPRTKFSKEQIEQVVHECITTPISYGEISANIGMSVNTVRGIAIGASHQWATEEVDPSTLSAAGNLRSNKNEKCILYDINNEKHEVTSAQDVGLRKDILLGLKKGRENRDGWSLVKHKYVLLISPSGDKATLTIPAAKLLLMETGELSSYQIRKLLNFTNAGGWQAFEA